MSRFSDGEIAAVKTRWPCDAVAGALVRLRKHGRGVIGGCPVCGTGAAKKGATCFEAWADRWVCAACSNGGDVIKLVMLTRNVDFAAAVEWLGGLRDDGRRDAAHPSGAPEAATTVPPQYDCDPAALVVPGLRGRDEAKQEQHTAARYREAERRRLFDIWQRAKPAAGSVVEGYLRRRGLQLPPLQVSQAAPLRLVENMPFFTHGGKVLHRGPAMVAALVHTGWVAHSPNGRPDAAPGIFSGLHFTWIDLAQPNGKALIVESGELRKPKKMRGTKLGCGIELVRPDEPARRLFVGEGIETVLRVYLALRECGADLSDAAFWAAGDLGNLAGKAAATIAHPTKRALVRGETSGRALRVPGPDPEPGAVAFLPPSGVVDVTLLADADSDPVLTRCAMYRAQTRIAGVLDAARSARLGGETAPLQEGAGQDAGAIVRVAWPPDGMDFADMVM